jgi:cytidylate kinase
MIITIDGPAGSGKSSLAKAVAKKLGMHHFQTGLHYRAAAWLWLKMEGCRPGVSSECSKKFKEVENGAVFSQEFLDELSKIETHLNIGTHISIDGKDVTSELMKSFLSPGASILSSRKEILDIVIPMHKKVGTEFDLLADGRNCGSALFPDAALKVFLTASVHVRANRLMGDPLRRSGKDFEQTVVALNERDKRDRERKDSPLVEPEDALVLDNSVLTVEQAVEIVVDAFDAASFPA